MNQNFLIRLIKFLEGFRKFLNESIIELTGMIDEMKKEIKPDE